MREAYLDLDLSSVKIEDLVQASVVPVASKNTEGLFAGGATFGDGELAQGQNVHVQSVVNEAHQPVNIIGQTEDTPVQQ